MKTIQIAISGIVQGVGFRPFIASLAKRLYIVGNVCNSSGNVIITAQAEQDVLNNFIRLIKEESPTGSYISKISVYDCEAEKLSSFEIIQSTENKNDEIIIPADISVCEKCVEELSDEKNPRFRYPFISCIACGARYSIINAVPYDRERTTMDSFAMCEFCSEEYGNDSRRCYAQTISCNNCGPQLIFKNADTELYGENALIKATEILKNGGILAVKSIGGYNYICRTDIEKTIDNLRILKGRENKPFAVMFRNITEIKEHCNVSEIEEALLKSPESPIVLLESANSSFCNNICKDSRFIGSFLPYTPLHYLLLTEFESLILTSANISDMPIITADKVMLEVNSEHLQGVLYNTREIVTPLDDSVARVVLSDTQLIRRSRGYVPLPIKINIKSNAYIFATGGDLKGCFCLLKNDKAYMSQFFGDLQNFEINESYSKAYNHMTELFNIKPEFVVTDKHPSYVSRALANKTGLKVLEIQHHVAHIFSVMAENSLDNTIGVSFDGTGYGDDGAIWGGEFFAINGTDYKRTAHLEYVKLCGGDLAAKDASLAEGCYLYASDIQKAITDKRFFAIKSAIDNSVNTQLTSSMGRLFDVVSSILGIKSYNSYEGECAICLENCAYNAIKSGEKPYLLSFDIIENDDIISIKFKNLIKEIINAKNNGASINALAFGFHIAVSKMILSVCLNLREKFSLNNVALSGGVFANKILLEKIVQLLIKNNFNAFFNKAVPTNDSGLALGQAYYAAKYLNNF